MKNCYMNCFQQQDKKETRNAFASSMLKHIKNDKAQLSKIGQPGEFLGKM